MCTPKYLKGTGTYTVGARCTRRCQGGGAATRLTADQLHSGSNPDLGLGHSGHSGGETPGPIPNPAVKPVHVSCGTEVRESPGTTIRCYDPSSFLFSYLPIQSVSFQMNDLFLSEGEVGWGTALRSPSPMKISPRSLFLPERRGGSAKGTNQ